MTDTREKIIQYIKLMGPVLPIQVSKHINTDIIFASAMLSELVARKLIRISHSKIGSSPVYYIEGQEDKLKDKVFEYLKEKEKQAYILLNDKQILKESQLEPWQRVALSNLKDFAIPLQVITKNGNEIFWKFHLMTNDSAKESIYNLLKEEQPKIEKSEQENTVEQKPEEKQLIFEPIKKDIELLSMETINKAKEFNFVVRIPSKIGFLTFLLKAKDQRSVNDKDLFLAYAEGQQKHLPVIYLSNTKKTTQKANEILSNKLKGQVILKTF